MGEDYRNTKYCPQLSELVNKKNKIKNSILQAHPRAKDMHNYISKNDESYKQKFIEAYNGKCAYCGVSIEIISWKMFEIDHFIPKEADRFEKSKANAGYIENLMLSCYECNRSKSDYECSDVDLDKINPDGPGILKSFVRDENYYIKVSDKMKDDFTVNSFYNKLELGNQLHRIDYLLMNMQGLSKKITSSHPAYSKLMDAINLLQHKRNIMR